METLQLVQPTPLRELRPALGLVSRGAPVETWPTLLILDSDPEMLRTLACFFEKRGFHVAAAESVAEAKTFFHRRAKWSLVIADFHLTDGSGWDFCHWLRGQQDAAPTPFLLMSGGLHAVAVCPEFDFLAKPFRIEDLEQRVNSLLGLPRN